jgi:hypothetical protein|tara:strand:- start:1936 stop:2112 length:177 start_codon:yes stop_codon:yes gene_type:complete
MAKFIRGSKMITVYIDYGTATEKLATFESESTFIDCLPTLERIAKDTRGAIVETWEVK